MKWDTVSFSRVDEIFSPCYTSGIEHLFYTDSSLTAAPRHADVIEKNKKPKRCPNQDKVRISCFWWRRMDSNHRSRRQQIYSLPPLATRELLHMKLWSWWTDSNPRPADYKSAALPTELHQHRRSSVTKSIIPDVTEIVNDFFSKKEVFCTNPLTFFLSGTGRPPSRSVFAPAAADRCIPERTETGPGDAPAASGGTNKKRRML